MVKRLLICAQNLNSNPGSGEKNFLPSLSSDKFISTTVPAVDGNYKLPNLLKTRRFIIKGNLLGSFVYRSTIRRDIKLFNEFKGINKMFNIMMYVNVFKMSMHRNVCSGSTLI